MWRTRNWFIDVHKHNLLSVRFKNLCISHVGILSWGNLIYTNSYIDFSVDDIVRVCIVFAGLIITKLHLQSVCQC